MSSNRRASGRPGRLFGWRRQRRPEGRILWFSWFAMVVETGAKSAAFAEAVNVLLQFGDDDAQRGDLVCKLAVDNRGQRRDDTGQS